jgi:undecaprenyl diphosphate synthase
MSDQEMIPRHIAIICDGNRRWARERGWQVFRGHERAVKKTMDEIVERASELGVEYLTFWIFSTENWSRSAKEIQGLMDLFRYIFDEKIKSLGERNIRVQVIGDKSKLDLDIQERISEGERSTNGNTGMTVTLAMNYGGRDEIVRAVKKLWQEKQGNGFRIEDLDEKIFAGYLDTSGMPDPELIIRTSGEQRLSGFMPWQQQYAEFYFPKVNFPDFDGNELTKAIMEFSHRQRRFGGG